MIKQRFDLNVDCGLKNGRLINHMLQALIGDMCVWSQIFTTTVSLLLNRKQLLDVMTAKTHANEEIDEIPTGCQYQLTWIVSGVVMALLKYVFCVVGAVIIHDVSRNPSGIFGCWYWCSMCFNSGDMLDNCWPFEIGHQHFRP